MPVRFTRLPFAALSLLLVFVAGCGTKSTRPSVTPQVRRTVTVVLTDRAGAPVSGEFVRATSLADSAGFGRLVVATTDAAGEAVFRQLTEGPWAFSASPFGHDALVAGVTTQVPGRTRPEGDTIVVAMALHVPSFVTGHRWLSRATEHSGTFVNVAETDAFAVTGSDGSFLLAPLPPGRWTLVAYHNGYLLGVTPFEVTAPGIEVVLPGDSLEVTSAPPPEPGEHF